MMHPVAILRRNLKPFKSIDHEVHFAALLTYFWETDTGRGSLPGQMEDEQELSSC